MTTDALTGKTDGMLARCLASNTCPKIIKTDTELEFYQGRAGLVAIDTASRSLTMLDNVRTFLLSSLQRAAGFNAKSAMTAMCAHYAPHRHRAPEGKRQRTETYLYYRCLLRRLLQWCQGRSYACRWRYWFR